MLIFSRISQKSCCSVHNFHHREELKKRPCTLNWGGRSQLSFSLKKHMEEDRCCKWKMFWTSEFFSCMVKTNNLSKTYLINKNQQGKSVLSLINEHTTKRWKKNQNEKTLPITYKMTLTGPINFIVHESANRRSKHFRNVSSCVWNYVEEGKKYD